jgi:hypothetical protein
MKAKRHQILKKMKLSGSLENKIKTIRKRTTSMIKSHRDKICKMEPEKVTMNNNTREEVIQKVINGQY